MTSPHLPGRPVPAEPAAVSWTLVAGLSALALLWPLTGLTGALGSGGPRALAIIGITAAVWIGVVGLGRVPRPVLTLTLTGLAYGLVATAIGTLVPVLSGFGGPGGGPAWTLVPALAFDTMWGALAGIAAAGVQRLRGGVR
ncbi:hypothetical protein [Promicromonospora sp. MEB111]|uniref:hypothetical protein n=1 Tax=Promicromonospora sp. MEB111 TaxID=3040301 RepID=UPI00254D4CEF|nr:hypothetical protein [Promicromonospora sp. MEB111]